MAAQNILRHEGIPSPRINALITNATIPESAASINTWYWWLLRAACPPEKSPLPHTTAEVMANSIPMRLVGSIQSPYGYGVMMMVAKMVKFITNKECTFYSAATNLERFSCRYLLSFL
jgi:hypothetical protein